ncbi:MAG: chemotaxis protein CheD [Thermodesulfobacteriota bacterium]
MTRHAENAPTIYLKPGEWFSGRERMIIRTVLGSCVAVTMFHRNTRLAAMCHALMPTCTENRGCSSYCRSSAKYVDCIVRRMMGLFFQRNIKAGDIQVKLFGGADSLSLRSGARNSLSMGSRNFQQARRAIENEGLRLGTSDVGGDKGRKLVFDTYTGEVLLKRLSPRTDTGTGRFLTEQIAGRIVSRGKAG